MNVVWGATKTYTHTATPKSAHTNKYNGGQACIILCHHHRSCSTSPRFTTRDQKLWSRENRTHDGLMAFRDSRVCKLILTHIHPKPRYRFPLPRTHRCTCSHCLLVCDLSPAGESFGLTIFIVSIFVCKKSSQSKERNARAPWTHLPSSAPHKVYIYVCANIYYTTVQLCVCVCVWSSEKS